MVKASKLCLAAFESPFEALYNGYRFSYAPVTDMCKKIKKTCQNFAQKFLSILSALFKVNTFTLFALKSKRIELQRSAWRHLTAFLKSFPTVTGFPMVFFTILMKCDKTCRTLVLNKIVLPRKKVWTHL